MSQQDINRDLGSYIKDRKDKPFWKKYTAHKIKPREDKDIDSAIKQELKKDFEHVAEKEEEKIAPEDKAELEVMEGEIKEAGQIEEVIDEEREGVMKKFFKKLNFSEKEEKPEKIHMSNNPDIDMSDEETRELLHGLHNWIIQLPADKLEKFKNSKEFELYTKYLRKHNLIR